VSERARVTTIRRIGVVGCGVMGSGIGEVCAAAGLDVRIAVRTRESASAGRQRLLDSLDRGVRRGRLTDDDRDLALARIELTTDLGSLADRQLVVEAVVECEPDKTALFAALDRIVEHPDAILASNTSAIPIERLGCATDRPGQVIGMHFFSPVPALPLVELVPSSLTTAQTAATAHAFVCDVLGKQAIRSPDRAGFVVNALLVPYLLSAIRMVEAGFASAEDIDRGMVLGCSHPVGPLRLVDLIGLDIIASVAEALDAEYRQPQYTPPPLLRRMVADGVLGRKTGRGFHEYA
jgi:3-hydroxybutyryl-CoA dehydrogenase